VAGPVAGILGWLWVGLVFGLVTALLGGLGAWLLVGLTAEVRHTDSGDPADVWRDDLAGGLIRGMVFGLMTYVGLAFVAANAMLAVKATMHTAIGGLIGVMVFALTFGILRGRGLHAHIQHHPI
jgi:hypothetical protein